VAAAKKVKKVVAKKAPAKAAERQKPGPKKQPVNHAPAIQQRERKAALGRVSQEQAKTLILDTAIAMLRDRPVSEVSSREIAHESGLNHSYIARYFGSNHEMLFCVVEMMTERVKKYRETGDIAGLVKDPDANLRFKLMEYLLAEGFPPERFAVLALEQRTNTEAFFADAYTLDKRAARVYRAKIGMLFILADEKLLAASVIDKSTRTDIINLFLHELGDAKKNAEKLGWQ
jgi:AcrR family transcriptional regulator